MKFTVEYPISAPGYDPALVRPGGMRRVVRAAEEAGFAAVGFTEHPAPSKKWLDAGGHEALDPIAALSYCAAVSERIRLMTHLLVLPYHNPFLLAKSLTTVDLLSEGRLTVVAGAGYLRSEFLAMGVDMAGRNARFDESIEVLRGVWGNVPFDHRGPLFEGRDVAALPAPLTPGGPPIWIGGNSALARRRAARNQGWSPFMTDGELARTARTAAITTVEQLARHVEEVCELAGRAVEVQVRTPAHRYMIDGGSAEEHRDHLGRLAEAGVTSFVVRPPGASVAAAVEALHGYAETFRRG
ncbi:MULTISPECIES: TIGR03619 family F420-dependent LLM class oxidoreductase [Nonomuraea]|uniref:TIGR03619 family F420-dependent LLM class oxidoreductase n=1 Tax=Nonomuraea ferruginea TaxID=46174 RepID=A0ABT4T3X8_9ACTN|nr:TIGR03619 family F420-dependent LLM class oxidoreductase [Nonomuraea ferruginea]MDA0644228.1 TIGR03619 family F420-dependent LLM class oxidoreductase [Nonomuraea ferruginea]